MPTARPRSRPDAQTNTVSRKARWDEPFETIVNLIEPASQAGREITAAAMQNTERGLCRYAEAFTSMAEALRPALGPWAVGVTTPVQIWAWTLKWSAGALSAYSEELERGPVGLPGPEPAAGTEIDLRESATASVPTPGGRRPPYG